MVRLTDRPDMTLDVYRGRKTTMQQQYYSLTHDRTNLSVGMVVVVVLLFYVHGKHLRSGRDGQLI